MNSSISTIKICSNAILLLEEAFGPRHCRIQCIICGSAVFYLLKELFSFKKSQTINIIIHIMDSIINYHTSYMNETVNPEEGDSPYALTHRLIDDF